MSVWYDISGLYNWQGTFTGIQRAVFNIGQSLTQDERADARFFIFQHGGFEEVQFAELEQRFRVSSTQLKGQLHNPARRPARAVVQHYAMAAAKQIVIGSRMEQPLRKTYGSLRSVYRGFGVRKATGNVPHAPFTAEDTVVVVDGNWQFRYFADAIIAAKAKSGFKLVHFVHDLVAVRNPAFASEGAQKIIGTYFESIFAVADKLLAISESTKRDIKWFTKEKGISTPPVDVVILGSDIRHDGETMPVRPAIKLPSSFILAVSTVEVRKNYLLLFYACKQAALQRKPLPHVVIVGRRGWMVEETYSLLTKDPDMQRALTILSGVSDQELEWLYRNCMFTVFPSFYEGWGLPIAESLLHGKCCVSSNTSSMPEVGGDLVHYVSPYDSGGLIKAIHDLSNDTTRKVLEKRIKSEYRPVTWRDTYEKFMISINQL